MGAAGGEQSGLVAGRKETEMIWPDVLIMVANFTFAPALLFSIFTDNKPARATCALTFVGLMMIQVGLSASGLWLGAVATMLTAVGWGILLVQGDNRC